jgi:putative endonuclease
MTNCLETGKRGERVVKNYLLKRGFIFLAANWRYKRKEIDLIFKNKKGLTIFIEVKTRKKENYINIPFFNKQKNNIKQAALNYCLKNKISLENIRFDLVLVLYKNNQANLYHYLDICK